MCRLSLVGVVAVVKDVGGWLSHFAAGYCRQRAASLLASRADASVVWRRLAHSLAHGLPKAKTRRFAGPSPVPLPGFEPAYPVVQHGVAQRKRLLTGHFRQLGLRANVAGWRGACLHFVCTLRADHRVLRPADELASPP
jgi:hypothetical protein